MIKLSWCEKLRSMVQVTQNAADPQRCHDVNEM